MAHTAKRKLLPALSGTTSSISSARGPTIGIGSKTKPATSRSGALPGLVACLEATVRPKLGYLGLLFLCLLVIAFAPGLTLWLPHLLGYQ